MVNMHRAGRHAEIPPVTIIHTYTQADVFLCDAGVMVSSRTAVRCIWEMLKWICSSWLKSCCSSLHNTHLTHTTGDLDYSHRRVCVCVWSHCISSVCLDIQCLSSAESVDPWCPRMEKHTCAHTTGIDLINSWNDCITRAECFESRSHHSHPYCSTFELDHYLSLYPVSLASLPPSPVCLSPSHTFSVPVPLSLNIQVLFWWNSKAVTKWSSTSLSFIK